MRFLLVSIGNKRASDAVFKCGSFALTSKKMSVAKAPRGLLDAFLATDLCKAAHISSLFRVCVACEFENLT